MHQRIIVFMPGLVREPTKYVLADYSKDQEPVDAKMVPSALIKLQKALGIADYPDKVIALTTKRAREQEKEIRKEFVIDGVEIPVEFVDIPDGQNAEELRTIVELLLTSIPDNAHLVIDVTHGFRGSPLLFSLAVPYLSLINPSVTVKEMYYGMLLRANGEQPMPIVDMSVYLDMLDWVYAMRVFRDTLVPNRLLDKIRSSVGEGGDPAVENLLRSLQVFGTATDAALPMHMARTAAALRDALSADLPQRLREEIPLGTKLFRALEDVAAEFVPPGGEVPERLDAAELARQARVIDKLLAHERVVQAIGLMNEWCTLKVLLHNSQNLDRWRDAKEQRAAKNLRKQENRWADARLEKDVKEIADLRNQLHHYGQWERDDEEVPLENLHSLAEKLWSRVKETAADPNKWTIRKS